VRKKCTQKSLWRRLSMIELGIFASDEELMKKSPEGICL
jgi:hypothetical protein